MSDQQQQQIKVEETAPVAQEPKTHLFVDPEVSSCIAAFGGQGSDWLGELRSLHKNGKSSVREFLELGLSKLEDIAASDEWYANHGGLNVRAWIASDKSVPSFDLLRYAPVSFPLIFMTQMANYMRVLELLGTSHEKVAQQGWFKGALGHSQGVVAAAVTAAASTDRELRNLSVAGLEFMSQIGLGAQKSMNFELSRRSAGPESPMLSVQGMSEATLLKAFKEATKLAVQKETMMAKFSTSSKDDKAAPNASQRLGIALCNGTDDYVVCGEPKDLRMLRKVIVSMSAEVGKEAQARVPFSKRKPVTQTTFLRMTAPFHSALNVEAFEQVAAWAASSAFGQELAQRTLRIPVWDTEKGADLRKMEPSQVVNMLARNTLVSSANLLSTLRAAEADCKASHLISFGPGSVAGHLMANALVGTGIQVIQANDPDSKSKENAATASSSSSRSSAKSLAAILTAEKPERIPVATPWGEKFAPKIAVRACDGERVLMTKYTSTIGRAPVMMSGMTPTTSFHGIDLVAACANAGYNAELAAGGLPTPDLFKMKVQELASKLNPGVGMAINMLYLNAYQWGFQFPLVCELAKAGLPIESITIGAGVPTEEKAKDIFDGLQGAGINLIGFKPGSKQAIRDVLQLASLRPSMNIMLQWTSGRGGGHHSFEDFHEPLLATYEEIRQHDNIILVIGSGFGDAQGVMTYLDGSWSQSPKFGRLAKMPVDGVLFGSRCMVAKEAATAPEVKQLIVDAAGLEDELSWEKSYDEVAGGVVTVQSELGEPIHKLATRGILLWREFDKRFFSLPRGEKRRDAILAAKDEIIAKLNADFQKPYFGRKRDGSVCEVEDMTYAEVLERMVQLMHIKNGGDKAGRLAPTRWIDPTYASRVMLMMQRSAARLAKDKMDKVVPSNKLLMEDPDKAIADFLVAIPALEDSLMADDDVTYFLDLCKVPTRGKPVNFVPVVDEDLVFWVKKDSLWFSEQLDAVPDRDPGRVCVLHGPVAARYSTIVDEPIADIMGNIHKDLVRDLKCDEVKVNVLAPVELQQASVLKIISETPQLVRGRSFVPNPIAKVLKREAFEKVKYTSEGGLESINVQDPERGLTVATLSQVGSDNKLAELQVFDKEAGAVLKQKFTIDLTSLRPIFQTEEDNLSATKQLYRTAWDCQGEFHAGDTFTDEVVVTSENIEAFNRGTHTEYNGSAEAPIDISIMAGWRPLARALFVEELQSNLLKLVHLTNGIRLPNPKTRTPVKAGEVIRSEVRITGITIQPKVGKKVAVKGIITRASDKNATPEMWVEMNSAFLIRGVAETPEEYATTFEEFPAETHVIDVKDATVAELVASRAWIKFDNGRKVQEGDRVTISLSHVSNRFAGPNRLKDIKVTGDVFIESTSVKSSNSGSTPLGSPTNSSVSGTQSDDFVDVDTSSKVKAGTVEFASSEGEEFQLNPVMSFLEKYSEPMHNGHIAENGGYELIAEPVVVPAPADCTMYARGSRDANPIHRESAFAVLADLPGGEPIVHGMWTACMARARLEEGPAGGNPARIVSYEASFVDMVHCGDELVVTAKQTGVKDGLMLINLSVNRASDRALVMTARAELEQPTTAYLFTGQGSASPGMGMDRYAASATVRKVWDVADEYLRNRYGFSILQIVRENPKSLTVHFGGPRGKVIRENLRSLQTEDPTTGKKMPLIPEISSTTKSFTFNSPTGLLFATQFSQPALVLVQKAAFEELREAGLVPEKAFFAGHSLGEYAALAGFADVLSVEDLVETVFLRGMVMQNAVPRDADGTSNYAMVAANPLRVGRGFTPETLGEVVDLLCEREDLGKPLLQIVNYNVRYTQYVVAGELLALDALGEALNLAFATGNRNAAELAEKGAQAALASLAKRGGRKEPLKRGKATIPLPGIDVPFHSRKLLPGVGAFRQLLSPRLALSTMERIYHRLVGNYIPNVTAEVLTLDRSYAEKVQKVTGSAPMLELLADYDSATPAEKCRTLVIELLAHQFAMPVRWIETQDLMFGARVQRVIEMGPAATLTTMAKHTLKSGAFGDADEYNPEIMWWKNDRERVYYELDDEGPSFAAFVEQLKAEMESEAGDSEEGEVPEAPAAPAPTPAPAPAPVAPKPAPTPVAAPAPAPSGGASTPDAPVDAKHVLRVLLASKLKKPIGEVPASTSVQTLSAGRSAVQNEIMGELSAEFKGGIPDNAGEMPLSELAGNLSSYKEPGAVSTKLVTRTLSAALPGGFGANAAKDYLTQHWGLGTGRNFSVLLHSCTMAPEKRLKSEEEGKQWLDSVCKAYGDDVGVSLSPAGAGGAGGAPSGMMMMPQMMSMGGPAAVPPPDAPVSALHAMRVMLATKFEKGFNEISDSATVASLSNGKSALQNEVAGDLAAEFGAEGDDSAQKPLTELAAAFQAGYSGPGKVLTRDINKVLGQCLPGGFGLSAARSYLASDRLLPAGRVESVMIHSLTMAPKERIKSAEDAKAWLDTVCGAYGSFAGIDIPRAGAGGGGGAMMGFAGPGVSSAEVNGLKANLQSMVETQLEALQRFMEQDPLHADRLLDVERKLRGETEAKLDAIHAELTVDFCERVQPQFDEKRVRVYDSFWNWVVQDAMQMHLHVLSRLNEARKGQSTGLPAGDANPHFEDMSKWLLGTSSSEVPPTAWFRNFLCNRATPQLLQAVKFFANSMHEAGHVDYAQAIALLAEQVQCWLNNVPVHVATFDPVSPNVRVLDNGTVDYFETPREGVPDAVRYVAEMSRGLFYVRRSPARVANPSQAVNVAGDGQLALPPAADSTGLQPADGELASGWRRPRSEAELARELNNRSGSGLEALDLEADEASEESKEALPEGPTLDRLRLTVSRDAASSGEDAGSPGKISTSSLKNGYESIHVSKQVPFVHLKSLSGVDKSVRILNEQLTSEYFSCLDEIATSGVSFAGQVALVTGAGAGSIGTELVKSLLEGGATVLCAMRTARSENALTKEYARFQNIYKEFGAKDSKLYLVPCNCASSQDMKSIVAYTYEQLGLDVDFVVPFAAAAQQGKDISSIDAASEASHRMMMTNVVRLLGALRDAKASRGIVTRPAMVLIPCSPNHGEFGNDGLYAESKLGCEALLNKWSSEGWGDYLSLAACVIGWTRSALMEHNNIVAPGIEALGCRTFAPEETNFNLVGLLHPRMVTLAAEEPLWADLTGNWVVIPNMKDAADGLRSELMTKSRIARAVATSNQLEESKKPEGGRELPPPESAGPLAGTMLGMTPFPTLPSEEARKSLSALEGMVDLRKVVVITGYGEVGPWGNARTRWEMESYGEFSLEGAIELAWMVGLIKRHDGPLPSGPPRQRYVGWVDATSGEAVADHEVKRRYEKTLLQSCGIRIVEPAIFEGYNPDAKRFLHSVVLDRDMPAIELASLEEGLQYMKELGEECCDVFARPSDGQYMMRVKKGAEVSIAKALKFNRNVAGQVPTGWDARRLGLPADIANSVDPVTLYTLVSTVEALMAAGLSDPYELYQYVHVSEVGNTSGGGMGGMRSLKRMFHQRKLDEDIPSDTLAESFINTMPAWVNMLLVSSSGPIKTPVGACATAAESLDIGMETILSGKARVVIAGGYDDFGEEGSYEFAQMGATNNTVLDAARGRTVRESSRPMSSSRAGFVESHGAGIQVLMDAELALEMGAPIFAILALTNTATDKQGRSIPAPGRGILTSARESTKAGVSPMLSLERRRQGLEMELDALKTLNAQKEQSDGEDAAFLERLVQKRRAAALETWGQGFFKNDPSIAPLRGALAVWGLGVDDLGVASFHGTSTKLNDTNESGVLNKQMEHLGRSKGNVLFVVAQKYLTGHPKGAACAWMVNGLVQCMLDARVPGNRNLDNVDVKLQTNSYLVYPNEPVQLPKIEAALLKSFGFGQAGAEVVIVHPDRLLATLSPEAFANYIEARNIRERRTFRNAQNVMSGSRNMVIVKEHPPYPAELEEAVYLDPLARASYDAKENTWTFRSAAGLTSSGMPKIASSQAPSSPKPAAAPVSESASQSAQMSAKDRLQMTMAEQAAGIAARAGGSGVGVGVDVENVSTFADYAGSKQDFIQRNFTEAEIAYCKSAADPAASFAGRWAAKEAVVKALSSIAPDSRSLWAGGHASLVDIEVVANPSGAPQIRLHGHPEQVSQMLAVNDLSVSISHTAEVAIANAIARK